MTLACILLWYGGQQVLISNYMSSEDFLRFILFIFALLQPARKLGLSLAAIQSGIAGADRTFSILDIKYKEKKNKDLISKKTFKNYIEFNNVFFKYNPKGKDILILKLRKMNQKKLIKIKKEVQ